MTLYHYTTLLSYGSSLNNYENKNIIIASNTNQSQLDKKITSQPGKYATSRFHIIKHSRQFSQDMLVIMNQSRGNLRKVSPKCSTYFHLRIY